MSGCVVREVEAQAVRRNQRALLRDVRAQHLAQRRVQQMGGGVVEHASRCARSASTRASTMSPTLSEPCSRRRSSARGPSPSFCVSATRNRAVSFCEHARVAHLAAGFGVEGRRVEHDLPVLARGECGDGLAVLDERDHAALATVVVVAGELGAALERSAPTRVSDAEAGSPRARARAAHPSRPRTRPRRPRSPRSRAMSAVRSTGKP